MRILQEKMDMNLSALQTDNKGFKSTIEKFEKNLDYGLATIKSTFEELTSFKKTISFKV